MPTYTQSLNSSLMKIMEEDESVYLIGEDICDPYGGVFKITKGLSNQFPGRVLNTPISEAAITGLGIGMSLRGFRPIVEIMFGDFLTLAADQIVSNLSKLSWMYNQQVKTPLVIRTPMGGRRGYGSTHSQCLEKMFLGIPEISIVCPSVYHDVGFLLRQCVLKDDKPTIFIEYKTDYSQTLKLAENNRSGEWFVQTTKDNYPVIFLSFSNFTEDDLTIITYGGSVTIVEEAAKQLFYDEEVSSEVVIVSLLTPFLADTWMESVKRTGRVIIVEEGTLTNGWGAEVSALITEKAFEHLKSPVVRVAAHNSPIGCAQHLEDDMLPSVDDIVYSAMKMI